MSFQELFKRQNGEAGDLNTSPPIQTQNGRPVISRDNPFEEAFQRFQNTDLYKSLAEEWRVKAYWESNRRTYWVAFYGSYVANAVSAATASIMVYFLLELVIPVFYLNLGLAAVSIFGLEWAKREVSDPFWHNGIQFRKWSGSWGAMMLFLFLLSGAGSVLGTDRAVKEFDTGYDVVDRSGEVAFIQAQIDSLDARIAEARGTKWQGTTTRKSQQAIADFSAQRADLVDRRLEIERSQEASNVTLANLHAADIDLRAWYAMILVAVLEVLFQICMRYKKYYRFRSIAEFGIVEGPQAAKFLRDDLGIINQEVLPEWIRERMQINRPGQFAVGRDESGNLIMANIHPKQTVFEKDPGSAGGSENPYSKGSEADSKVSDPSSGRPQIIVGDSSGLRKEAWNSYYAWTKGAKTQATKEKNRLKFEAARWELWDTFQVLCQTNGAGSVTFIQPPESSDRKFQGLIPKNPLA